MSHAQVTVVCLALAWLMVRSMDGEKSKLLATCGYVWAALLVFSAVTGKLPLT